MTMSREPGTAFARAQARSAFTLTIDHWLVIGPIALALLIAASLILMG